MTGRVGGSPPPGLAPDTPEVDVIGLVGAVILALVAAWLLLILVLWLIRPRDVRAGATEQLRRVLEIDPSNPGRGQS